MHEELYALPVQILMEKRLNRSRSYEIKVSSIERVLRRFLNVSKPHEYSLRWQTQNPLTEKISFQVFSLNQTQM
jgi:hypothetical protein